MSKNICIPSMSPEQEEQILKMFKSESHPSLSSSPSPSDSSNSSRISWQDYFIRMAYLVSERATCNRGKVGSIVVRENRILSTGYNGAPEGLPHCLDVGCDLWKTIDPGGEEDVNCLRVVHAEMNAVAQLARSGASGYNTIMYSTHSPCIHCVKVLINVGIYGVYYDKPYRLATISNIVKINEAQKWIQL